MLLGGPDGGGQGRSVDLATGRSKATPLRADVVESGVNATK